MNLSEGSDIQATYGDHIIFYNHTWEKLPVPSVTIVSVMERM